MLSKQQKNATQVFTRVHVKFNKTIVDTNFSLKSFSQCVFVSAEVYFSWKRKCEEEESEEEEVEKIERQCEKQQKNEPKQVNEYTFFLLPFSSSTFICQINIGIVFVVKGWNKLKINVEKSQHLKNIVRQAAEKQAVLLIQQQKNDNNNRSSSKKEENEILCLNKYSKMHTNAIIIEVIIMNQRYLTSTVKQLALQLCKHHII